MTDEDMPLFMVLRKAKLDCMISKNSCIRQVEEIEAVLRQNGELAEHSIFYKIRDKWADISNRSNFYWAYTKQGRQLKYIAGWIGAIICTAILFDMPKIVQAYYILNGSEYVVKGTVTNNTNNAEVMYMSYNNSDDPEKFVWVVDSAKIVNDNFIFEGKTQYPARAYLSTSLYNAVEHRTKEQTAVLYLEPRNTVSCIINLEHPFDSIKVYNSPTDSDLRYVINKMKPIDERIGSIQLQYSLVESVGDITQMAKLRNEFDIVNIERTKDWLSTLLSLDKTSAVVFDDYVSMLLNNEYITKEQFIQIENRFNEVPWYIKNCNSGKRVSKAIESTKKYFNEKS